jgi:hypothetical protein
MTMPVGILAIAPNYTATLRHTGTGVYVVGGRFL